MDSDSKKESYEAAIRRIEAAWTLTTDKVARLAMVAGYLVKRSSDTIWAGFFFLIDGELTVGPYNGPPALPVLPKHEGVCWSCVDSGKPVVVPNTHEFEGHLRRTGPSNSEITVPIKDAKRNVVGVLHHDSADFDIFDEIDVEYLEKIAGMVEQIL